MLRGVLSVIHQPLINLRLESPPPASRDSQMYTEAELGAGLYGYRLSNYDTFHPKTDPETAYGEHGDIHTYTQIQPHPKTKPNLCVFVYICTYIIPKNDMITDIHKSDLHFLLLGCSKTGKSSSKIIVIPFCTYIPSSPYDLSTTTPPVRAL
ncbi:hypothetical protein BDZ97DRAFT_547665 [Flammula alnicola]|nr:hypothetical protein BDZ97DRAFT_547665 [Flammula alnicola]